jgi:hypothetical protein
MATTHQPYSDALFFTGVKDSSFQFSQNFLKKAKSLHNKGRFDNSWTLQIFGTGLAYKLTL